MFLRKERAGSDSHGHHWPHDGAIVEVADHLVHDLLAIRDAGFSIVEHHQPEQASEAGGNSDQTPAGDGQPEQEVTPVSEPQPIEADPVTEPAPPTEQPITEQAPADQPPAQVDKPRRGGRPRKATTPPAEVVTQPEG